MFTTIIVQPIFNLLVLIYAVIPGHNFGVAIILFTLIIRLLLWPLVKRQLHQTKRMRQIQPELRRIAKETKGDKQKQYQLQMELYKERGIKPAASFGVMLIQFPILIGLYIGLRKVTADPHQIIDFAYPALQNLPWIQHLATNIKAFDSSLFGVVDLHKAAIGPNGLYVPALLLVLASVVTQYFQARQLLPNDKEQRSLRTILKEAGQGKQADQQEVNAAVSRLTIFFLPAMIFIFTVNLPAALSLYWFVGGLIAYIQQSIVLREDEEEMEELAEESTRKKNVKTIPEAEVVETPAEEKTPDADDAASSQKSKQNRKKTSKSKAKRRRK